MLTSRYIKINQSTAKRICPYSRLHLETLLLWRIGACQRLPIQIVKAAIFNRTLSWFWRSWIRTRSEYTKKIRSIKIVHWNCSKWVKDISIWRIRFWSLDPGLCDWFITRKEVKCRRNCRRVGRLGSEQIDLCLQNKSQQNLSPQNIQASINKALNSEHI